MKFAKQDSQGRDKMPNTITCINTVKHDLSKVHSIHYVSSKIIIANPDTIKIWDAMVGAKSLSTYPLTLSRGTMKMTPTSEKGYLIMPCEWQTFLLWNMNTGGQAAEYRVTTLEAGEKSFASCTDIATNNDINTFVTSWDNGLVSQWDLRVPLQLCFYEIADEPVIGITFDGHYLWAASRDKCVRCLDLRHGRNYLFKKKFEHNLRSLSYSSNRGLMAIGMDNGNIVVSKPENLSAYVVNFGADCVGSVRHSRSAEWFLATQERKIIICDSYYPVRSVVFQRQMPHFLDSYAISPDDGFITTLDSTHYSQTCKLSYDDDNCIL